MAPNGTAVVSGRVVSCVAAEDDVATVAFALELADNDDRPEPVVAGVAKG